MGKHSKEYESLPEGEGVNRIDEIVKDRKKVGHSLKGMLKKISSLKVLSETDIEKKYKNSKHTITEILERSYLECRYPTPNAIHKSFPIKRNSKTNIFEEPIGSDALRKYSFALGKKILENCEAEFNIKILNCSKLSSKISDDEWKRFSNVFSL